MSGKKDEKAKNIIEIISIVVPAIASVLSTIFEMTLNDNIWHILSIIFVIITVICSFSLLIINIKKEKKYIATIQKLNNTIDYYCEGKKCTANDVTVEFLRENLSYRISICKKFEILSLDRPFISYHLHCDKYPEDAAKSQEYYSDKNNIWDNIKLQVSMVVHRSKTDYKYSDIIYEKIREDHNHVFFRILYKQLRNNQSVDLPIEIGDVIEVFYSFVCSTDYWGSYINRSIDYNKAVTTVNFIGANINHLHVVSIDVNGNAKLFNDYAIKKADNRTTIILPSDISLYEIKNQFYRIYWDADAIFGKVGLNSSFVGAYDPSDPIKLNAD